VSVLRRFGGLCVGREQSGRHRKLKRRIIFCLHHLILYMAKPQVLILDDRGAENFPAA